METTGLNNGKSIPMTGFGTWQLHAWEAASVVATALQTGYRLIDTARIYLNERAVGRAVNDSGIPRAEIMLTTKLWNMSHGYKRTHRAFNASLRRLRQEYVDLYLIHWPVADKRRHSWKALEEIYRDGRAKAIGVSNYTVRHLQEMLDYASILPAVNQVEFHPFLYEEQADLLAFCKKHGIVIEAYSPLAHGHGLADPVIAAIAKAHRKTSAQVMLRWAVQHRTVPLPKATAKERIVQNFDIFDFVLSDTDMQAMNGLSRGLRTCWNPEDME